MDETMTEDLPRPVLVVGLGNPGPAYRRNRHNVGFMILERIADPLGISMRGRGHLSRWGTGTIEGKPVLLARPWTYMNRSGLAVGRLMKFYGVGPRDLIVAHDDLDMETGKVRIKRGGGHGGHNGLRSIIQAVGTGDFRRVKVGIGRPPAGMTGEEWVLSDFAPEEKPSLESGLEHAAKALLGLIRE